MNFLDFIFIALLLFAAWKGFKRGFVIEFFTFLALFLGLYAGIHFSNFASIFLREHLNVTTEYLPAISFTLIFLAVGAMIYFGGKAVEKIIKIIQLSFINKILGFVFSLLKMIFLIGAGILIIESYNEKEEFISEQTKTNSLLFYPLKNAVTFSIPAFEESTLFLKNVLTEEEELPL